MTPNTPHLGVVHPAYASTHRDQSA